MVLLGWWECLREIADEAFSAVGRPDYVIGSGTFKMWGCEFNEFFKVMDHLPSTILVGRRFWRKYGFNLTLGKDVNSIVYGGRPVQVLVKNALCDLNGEKVTVLIEDSDIDVYIQNELDVAQFSVNPRLFHR